MHRWRITPNSPRFCHDHYMWFGRLAGEKESQLCLCVFLFVSLFSFWKLFFCPNQLIFKVFIHIYTVHWGCIPPSHLISTCLPGPLPSFYCFRVIHTHMILEIVSNPGNCSERRLTLFITSLTLPALLRTSFGCYSGLVCWWQITWLSSGSSVFSQFPLCLSAFHGNRPFQSTVLFSQLLPQILPFKWSPPLGEACFLSGIFPHVFLCLSPWGSFIMLQLGLGSRRFIPLEIVVSTFLPNWMFSPLFLHIPSSCSLFHFRDRRRGLRPPRPIPWLLRLSGHLLLVVCVLRTFQTCSFDCSRLRLSMTFPGWLLHGGVPVLTDFLGSGSLRSNAAHPGISTPESENVFTVALESLGCSMVFPPCGLLWLMSSFSLFPVDEGLPVKSWAPVYCGAIYYTESPVHVVGRSASDWLYSLSLWWHSGEAKEDS